MGTIVSLLGLVIGIWMYRFDKGHSAIPYRGQKRWHMVLGLIFGGTASTWAFSGMLSMDPFPIPASSASGPQMITNVLRARLDLSKFDSKSPRQALQELAQNDVKELELISIANEPAYLATCGLRDTWLVPVDGILTQGIGSDRVIRTLASVFRPGTFSEIRQTDHYDAYYLDRRRKRPLPVILAKLNDVEWTRYYIDPATAQLVGSYSSRSGTTRWLYHGLHFFDFPWLYERRSWDIVVISLLSGGAALSMTSILLSWRLLRRRLTSATDIS